MFIYGKNSRLGPITNKYKTKDNKYATTLIEGDKITLVIIEPISAEASYILINKVIHGYKNIMATYGFGEAELDCHIDANCSLGDGWNNEKNAITRILIYDNQFSCSGVLLNNNCHNFIPYVLTGFHCVDFNWNRILDSSEENDIDTWVFDFLYLSPNCTPITEPATYPSFSGAVENGSSGAPLFDPNHRVIGQLVGTIIKCPPELPYYGKFDRSWNTGSEAEDRLSDWLGGGTNDQYTNTLSIPYVSGDNYVCWNNPKQYYINNLPAGATVTWSWSSNLKKLLSYSNYIVVLPATSASQGAGYVKARIRSGTSCPYGDFQKDVWVGRPNSSGENLIGGYYPYPSPFPCIYTYGIYYGLTLSG